MDERRPQGTSVWLILFLVCGCGSDFPGRTAGNTVRGRISYDGSEHRSLEEPTLGIFAFAAWPHPGPPHASRLYVGPDLDGPGHVYELEYLPARSYVVFAHLMDLNKPAGTAPAASGGYPDFCTFEKTWVEVNQNEPAVDIDFVLFDQAGADDPCNANLEPEPGRATIAVHVEAPGLDYNADSTDRLRLAVFAQWPPTGPPVLFRELAGESIRLPATLIANTVLPGEYAISVCLDIGGTSFDCGGEEDHDATYNDGELVLFTEGDIIQMRMNLVTGTGERI